MASATRHYTVESILTSLGYSSPLMAARDHARLILLGRLARYEASARRFETKWQCTLDELRARYMAPGHEDPEADDDYLEWQWYADATTSIRSQLDAIAEA